MAGPAEAIVDVNLEGPEGAQAALLRKGRLKGGVHGLPGGFPDGFKNGGLSLFSHISYYARVGPDLAHLDWGSI